MPQPPGVSPAPFRAAGTADISVIIVHGFTGSAAETRPLGERLAARGWSVNCPLLPRHGTEVAELTRGDRSEWLAAVHGVLLEAADRGDRIFLVGMSLGSLLCLRLAELDAAAPTPTVQGVVALSPAIRVSNRLLPLTVAARHVVRYDPQDPVDDSVDPTTVTRNWCYDRTPLWGAAEVWRLQREVRRNLAWLSQPLLVVQGRQDTTVTPESGTVLLAGVSSADREMHWLEQSGHNVLLDGERERLYALIGDWIANRAE